MARPFVFIGTTMLISLLFFEFCGFQSAVAVFCAALAAGIISLILGKNEKFRKVAKTSLVISLALVLSSTSFCYNTVFKYNVALRYNDGNKHSFYGSVTDISGSGDRNYYTLKVITADGEPDDLKIRILSASPINVAVGDKLTVNDVTVYVPGSTEMSERNYKANGVFIGGHTYDSYTVEKTDKMTVARLLANINTHTKDTIGNYLPQPSMGIATAMLTGDKELLTDDAYLNFRYTGVSHLFAVSGFHLSLWCGIAAFIINKLFGKKNKLGSVVSIIFAVFFMGLMGFTKSVLRAGIMMISVLFSGLFKRYRDSLSSLFFALSAILLVNPFAATSISLLMSFAATLGIITVDIPLRNASEFIGEKIKSKPARSAVRFVYTGIMVSFAASLYTMPICMVCFGYISVASPLANLLIMLPAEAMIFLSGLAVVIAPIGFLSKFIFVLVNYIGKYIAFITGKISGMKHIMIDVDSIFVAVLLSVVIAVMLIATVYFAASERYKYIQAAVAACFAVTVIISIAVGIYNENSVKIRAVKVGDGTTVIVENQGKTAVIGCGGSNYYEYNFKMTLSKYYTECIDLLIVPNNEKSESNYKNMLKDKYTIGKIIVAPDASEVAGENIVVTNGYEEQFTDDVLIQYITNENFSGARITADGFGCTVLFRTGSDFTYAPPSWSEGDVIIAKHTMPTDENISFDTFFISTNKDILHNDPDIYTTQNNGELTAKLSPAKKLFVRSEKK